MKMYGYLVNECLIKMSNAANVTYLVLRSSSSQKTNKLYKNVQLPRIRY